MGKGLGASWPLRIWHSPYTFTCHQPGSSPNLILLGFYGGLMTQAQLINSLAIDFGSASSSFPSRRSGGRSGSSSLWRQGWFSYNQQPSSGLGPKPPHWHNKRYFVSLIIYQIPSLGVWNSKFLELWVYFISIYLSIHLFVYLSVCLSIYLIFLIINTLYISNVYIYSFSVAWCMELEAN